MCLDNEAHGVVPTHEIFQKPLPVDIEWHDILTPAHYRDHWNGRELGETMRAWQVQDAGYKSDPNMPAGVVAGGWGYADSPDSEFIASGVNTKGPRYASLGRHGPFFQWGFSAAPPGMTESARRAFVNAICYIAKFDGQAPLTRKRVLHRGWMLDRALGYANIETRHAELVEHYAERKRVRARAETVQESGERELTEEEQLALRYPAGDAPSFDAYQRLLLGSVPAELVEQFGTGDDAWPKYLAYYEDNVEFLVRGERGCVVDEDAKALGLSNRDPAILERAVALLEAGDDTERARRILRRYTGHDFADAHGWRTWLTAVGDELFFSDVGGFRFYVPDPDLAARAGIVGRDGDEPDDGTPVTIDASVFPTAAAPGDVVRIAVRLRIAPGWHCYADVAPDSPYAATTLTVELPDGVDALGDWSRPAPEPYAGEPGTSILTGDDVVFVRALRLPAAATDGTLAIGVDVAFQTCDARRCLPPTTVRATATATVTAPRR